MPAIFLKVICSWFIGSSVVANISQLGKYDPSEMVSFCVKLREKGESTGNCIESSSYDVSYGIKVSYRYKT